MLTRAEGVAVLVQELVAGVEDVAGVVAHGEVQGGDARVVAKALVRLQLLPQLLPKRRVCGLQGYIPLFSHVSVRITPIFGAAALGRALTHGVVFFRTPLSIPPWSIFLCSTLRPPSLLSRHCCLQVAKGAAGPALEHASGTDRGSQGSTLGKRHSSSRRERMPVPLGGRASSRSTHTWLSSKSTCAQSMPSASYVSCSTLNRCLHGEVAESHVSQLMRRAQTSS